MLPDSMRGSRVRRSLRGQLLYLLYSSYCNDRALHSFPTRRSSDLENLRARTFCKHLDLKTIQHGIAVFRQAEISGAQLRKDRKSTRLNSSHVAISYAVFCLRKKIIERLMRDPELRHDPSGQPVARL